MSTNSIIKVILITISLICSNYESAHSQINKTNNTNVVIEYIENNKMPFDFSIKYVQWRNQIHIRSDKPLRSLQLYTDEEVIKEYNIIGSELIVLPTRDFTSGALHRLEATFIDDTQVIDATIIVTEK